ncbi:MAG TPA: hypothetical protein VHO84_05640 [Syntrophorhabdaceae bacterium]|nr:hypothetical protein [Syntrophorhabdaceae bacterium]
MSRMASVEVLPTKKQDKDNHTLRRRLRPTFTKKRLFLAFVLAVLADGLSLLLTPAPPLQWTTDLVTAVLLFLILGRQWILLPGLIMEAIPVIYIFPFWVLVVGAIAIWGTPRPTLNGTFRSGKM